MPEQDDVIRSKSRLDPVPMLLLLLLLGLGMQLLHFSSAPPGINGDAARLGLHALDLIESKIWPFYIYHQAGPQPLIVYLQALAFAFFGFTLTALRGVTAFGGALAVPAAYVAGKELFYQEGSVVARRSGLVAAVGMALDPFFNLYCRYGIEGALLPVVELLAVTFLWRGLRRGRNLDFILAGALVGLSQYIYIVARWFPVALAIACGLALVANRQLLARWRGLALAALSAALVALPQWLLFLRLPYTFVARTQGSDQPFVLSLPRAGSVLVSKLAHQVLMLGFRWDNGYNPFSGRPLLTPILFLGLPLALAGGLVRRRAGRLACLALAALMLLPDLLIVEGVWPSATRVFPAAPFVFLAAGLGCALLWSWLEERPRVPTAVAHLLPVAVLLAGIESQWHFATQVRPQLDGSKGLEWQASLVEVAEAGYIAAHADSALLLPSSEYQRAPLAFLLADAFPHRAGGYPVPLDPGDVVTVVSPVQPERPTTDGIPAGYIEGEWTLLKGGKAYLLPPLPGAVEPTGPQEPLWATNGALAAHVFPARWRGMLPEMSGESASFSNGLDLVGHHLGDLVAGQPLTVTLYWRPRTRIEDDAQVFLQLLDRQDQARLGVHDWPTHGAYRIRAWAPGEIVPLTYRLPIPADLAPGPYRLICGLVDLKEQTRVPLVSGEEFATVTTAKIALPAGQAVPDQPVEASFGDEIDLTGYTLSPQASGLEVGLFWKASAVPGTDYTVFVHLVDAADRLVAQVDAQPLDGAYPTSIWSPGESVADERLVPAPPGQYRVYVGLYQWETLERLPVVSGGEPVPDGRLLLGSITIP